MAKLSTARPYALLAQFYDRVMPQAAGMNRYARGKTLGRILPQVSSVCELGCGTGATALDLARRGLRVFAVDLSPTMCRLTRQKARQARLPVRVLRGDMRTFRLPRPVDLVTCEFASLNNVPGRSDLPRVLRAVYRALRPGGWFYFDVNTPKPFEEISSLKEKVETREFVALFAGTYDRRRRQARVEVDWFVRTGRSWRRHREEIPHACWTDAEIRRSLRRPGFGRIRVWDGTQVRPAWIKPRRGYDTYYLAQKIR